MTQANEFASAHAARAHIATELDSLSDALSAKGVEDLGNSLALRAHDLGNSLALIAEEVRSLDGSPGGIPDEPDADAPVAKRQTTAQRALDQAARAHIANELDSLSGALILEGTKDLGNSLARAHDLGNSLDWIAEELRLLDGSPWCVISEDEEPVDDAAEEFQYAVFSLSHADAVRPLDGSPEFDRTVRSLAQAVRSLDGSPKFDRAVRSFAQAVRSLDGSLRGVILEDEEPDEPVDDAPADGTDSVSSAGPATASDAGPAARRSDSPS